MTEDEKYLFDLRGYVKIEMRWPETLAQMNAGWTRAGRGADQGVARADRRRPHLDDVIAWGPSFRRPDGSSPNVSRSSRKSRNRLRLDHDYAIFAAGSGLNLHGPTLWP